MPAWCNNRLEVYGPELAIQKFIEKNYQIGQNTEILKSSEMVTFSFQSAWDPPVEFITEIAESFPTLNMDLCYYESTSMIAGSVEFRNGVMFKDEHYENDDEMVHEFVWENFSTDLHQQAFQ